MNAHKKASKKTAAERVYPTINEMDRRIKVSALDRAYHIDEHLGRLHAAVLHMRGEFVVPPSEACEIIDDALEGIRFETAQLRRAQLGLE